MRVSSINNLVSCTLVDRRLTLSQLYPNRNLRNVIEEWLEIHGMPEHSAPPADYEVRDPEVTAAAAAAARAAAAAEAEAAAVVDPHHLTARYRDDDATRRLEMDHADVRAVSERLASLRLALYESRVPAAAVTAAGQPGRPLVTLCKMVRGSRYPALSARDRENAAFILRDAVKARTRDPWDRQNRPGDGNGGGGGDGGGGNRLHSLVDVEVETEVVPLALKVAGDAFAPPALRNAAALMLWDLCVEEQEVFDEEDEEEAVVVG